MPRLLDLFSCGGGAAMGYHRAGFEVVGNDLNPQPHYPFEFHQGDALEYLADHWREFDVIHASPPCQSYSITKHAHTVQHPDLLEPTRAALIATGLPYVIENVEGAPLINPVRLCGTEFGLTALDVDGVPLAMQRHRLFESNVPMLGAGGCKHDRSMKIGGAYGGSYHRTPEHRDNPKRKGGYTPARPVRAALLGIDWEMTDYELAQAIPPAYTEFIGTQLLRALTVAA